MRDGEATNSPVLVRANIGDRVNLLGVRSGSYYYTDRVETEYVYFADLNPRGSAPKKGFVGSNPAWSPDGKLVAFKRFRDRVRNEVDVVVHSLESGQEKVYSSKIGFSSASGPVVWTHDGTGLVVDVHKFGADLRSPGMLYRVDLKSGAYREIPNAEVPGPAFTYPWLTWALSPDDKTVYFSRRATGDDPAGVFAADLAGGPARFVRPPVDRGFKLSPDGRTFLRSKDSFSFEQVAVDGTDSREFRVNPLLNGGPVWTPDGRGILFGVWTPRDATAPLTESGKTRIMRVPAGGGDQAFTGVELRGGVGGLILSPDGSRLAFSTRESATELWALDNVASALR
jgi:Tol biopolymer transport system component